MNRLQLRMTLRVYNFLNLCGHYGLIYGLTPWSTNIGPRRYTIKSTVATTGIEKMKIAQSKGEESL